MDPHVISKPLFFYAPINVKLAWGGGGEKGQAGHRAGI